MRKKSTRNANQNKNELGSSVLISSAAGKGKSSASRERWQRWKEKFSEFRKRLHRKGRERLTVMVIPHTEKQILNFHLSLYSITAVVALVSLIMVVSIVSLVGKSGQDLTHYGMGLDNKQFKLQSLKMAEEMIPLHEIINQYSNTISELYVKLDGARDESRAQGGLSQSVIDGELSTLKRLTEACKKSGSSCSQGQTKEILRRVIFLSKQDNQNLKNAIDISDKIIAELKTREKQNILKHTPSIWPTRGYLLNPYGTQTNQMLGKKVFRRGIEIGAMQGTEVYASAPGSISAITWDSNYGLRIKIKHRYGMKTYYAHLDRAVVKKGDRVTKGQVIGYVGKSGNTPIPMLYYEVHVGTIAYNPHAFLNHLQDQWLIQPKP